MEVIHLSNCWFSGHILLPDGQYVHYNHSAYVLNAKKGMCSSNASPLIAYLSLFWSLHTSLISVQMHQNVKAESDQN